MFKQAVDNRDSYFDYVINVLGVKSVYRDLNDPVVSSVPLLVQVEKHQTYAADESELLEKMLTALKIDFSLIQVSPYIHNNSTPCEYSVIFCDTPEKLRNELAPRANQVVTYSPRRLLHEAQLKKQAWADLQNVIQFFSSRI